MMTSPALIGSSILGLFTSLSIYFFANQSPASLAPIQIRSTAPKALVIKPLFKIDSDNYAALKEGYWLMAITVPWCLESQKISALFHDLPRLLAEKSVDNVNVAILDAYEKPVLASMFEIQGYPTIKFIKDGHVRKFGNHSVSASTLMDYLQSGWKKQSSYINLPKKSSVWYFLQLKLYHEICKWFMNHQLSARDFLHENPTFFLSFAVILVFSILIFKFYKARRSEQ